MITLNDNRLTPIAIDLDACRQIIAALLGAPALWLPAAAVRSLGVPPASIAFLIDIGTIESVPCCDGTDHTPIKGYSLTPFALFDLIGRVL
jgi:hypothetical protein